MAALVSSALVVLIVVLPLLGFAVTLIREGGESFTEVQSWLQAGNLEKLLSWEGFQPLRSLAERYLAPLGLGQVNLRQILMNASSTLGQALLAKGPSLLGNATELAIRAFLLILLLFYFLRDGSTLVGRLRQLLPLARAQEESLIQRVRALTNSVILGNAATAVAQGVAGGIGLWISGIPAFFWGTMMAFTSLIPAVGTALVWAPAVAYLAIIGHWGKAVFLLVWCVVIVGSIDNFLRPYLMGGRSGLSTIYLFFAILGGIELFGVAGILYGPLVLGVCAILIYLYELEYKEVLTDEPADTVEGSTPSKQ